MELVWGWGQSWGWSKEEKDMQGRLAVWDFIMILGYAALSIKAVEIISTQCFFQAGKKRR